MIFVSTGGTPSTTVECYKFNEAAPKTSKNIGVLICYALATQSNMHLMSLELAPVHDFENSEDWIIRYNTERFSKVFQSLDDFLLCFGHDDLKKWRLNIDYKGVPLRIIGWRKKNEISIFYPKTKEANIESFLMEVEKVAYGLAAFSRFYMEECPS